MTINRLFGIDVARGVAILGMFALHAIPGYTDDAVGRPALALFGDQRVQILFAFLDGVALGIIAQTATGSRRDKRTTIAIRGLFFVAIGLFLSTLGSGIVVILDYYGIYFFLMLPLIYLKVRWLVALGTVLLLFGPAVAGIARAFIGDPSAPAFAVLPPLVDRITSWLLVGQYPAIQFLSYVIAGLVFFRVGMLSRKLKVGSLAAGSFLAVTLPRVSDVSTSIEVQATATLASSLCFAVAFVSSCLLVFDSLDRKVWPVRAARFAFRPLASLGTMPITVYSLHVIHFAVLASFVSTAGIQSMETWLIITVVGLVTSTVWVQLFGRGPFERLIRVFLPNDARPENQHDDQRHETPKPGVAQ